MLPSDAIELLAKLKRTEHNDIFEVLIILAKTIVHEGVQFELNDQAETQG